MKTRLALIACLTVAAALPGVAHATMAVDTGFATVTQIRTGWSPANVMLVITSVPVINPHGCTATDGYSTEDGDAANAVHHATVLAAFLSGSRVNFVINGCATSGRPRIISVYITN